MDDVGGKIVFRFKKPIYQVHGVKMLGITSSKGRILGRTGNQTKLRADIPIGEAEYVPTENWYNVKKIRVNLAGPGAVAALDLTYCNTTESRIASCKLL